MMTTHEKPAGAGEHAAGLGSNADDSRIIPSTGDYGKSFSALAERMARYELVGEPTGGAE